MHKKSIHHSIVKLHSGLAKFYEHKMFFSFGRDIIDIFIPIYLLTLGFSFPEVLLWFLAKRAVQPFALRIMSGVSNRIGIKKTILLSLLMFPVYYLLLWQLTFVDWLFFPSALLFGWILTTYWSQELTLFMEVAKSKKAGIQRGTVGSLKNIISFIAPLLGGIIFTLLGMPLLIVLAAVVLLFSIVPLLSIKEAHFRLTIPKHDHTKKHTIPPHVVGELLFRGFMHASTTTFFPVFLFLLGFTILDVGIVGTIFGLSGIVAPLVIGKLIDQNRHRVVIGCAVLGMITWASLILFPGKILFLAAAVALDIAGWGFWLSVSKRMTSLGRKKDPSYFGTVFELFDDAGDGLGILLFLILYILGGLPAIVMGIIAVSVVFMVWKLTSSSSRHRS